jgi:hypothetical protein
MSDDQLDRELALVVADLDRRRYPLVGVVHRARRRLSGVVEPTVGCCDCGCGRPLEGRQRRWATPACRARAYRAGSASSST